MEQSQAPPGSQGNNHQQVILRIRADNSEGTFTRPAGPNHQQIILRHRLQSDQRSRGPDHQHVVLRRRDESIQSVAGQLQEPPPDNNNQSAEVPQIPASLNPTTSENAVHPSKKLQPADVYIFNHEKFSHEERKGSREDVLALHKTFEKLQCKVTEIRDPTLANVKHEVHKLAVANFDAHSALVVVILSHGKRNEEIKTCDNKFYNLDTDVLFRLFGNQSLRGKPKILIVQACKGTMAADVSPIDICCDPRDYIKCYSTTEGFLSYRDELNGSIYIQTLCKVMDQDALTKDFRRIIENVNAKVTEESAKK